MADNELRAWHWIAVCPDPEGGEPSTFRMRHRETEPGQLDGVTHEPMETCCWTGDHDGHTLYPCTAAMYDADDGYVPLTPMLDHVDREVRHPAVRSPESPSEPAGRTDGAPVAEQPPWRLSAPSED